MCRRPVPHTTYAVLTLVAALLASSRAPAEERESRWIERTFEPEGVAFHRVVVDNVFGDVVVTGAERDSIGLRVRETIVADDAKLLERARAEVGLRTAVAGGVLDLYVDGPFRDRDERSRWRQHEKPGYRVEYDFELAVPRSLAADVRTVTDGDVSVQGLDGWLALRNVNGDVEVGGARSAVLLATVNGDVRVSWSVAPPAGVHIPAEATKRFGVGQRERDGERAFEGSVRTVNGDIRLVFPEPLDAELELESSFGELLTEFDYELLESPPRIERRSASRLRYRAHGATHVRIGRGGPRLQCTTLNGDVVIRRAG